MNSAAPSSLFQDCPPLPQGGHFLTLFRRGGAEAAARRRTRRCLFNYELKAAGTRGARTKLPSTMPSHFGGRPGRAQGGGQWAAGATSPGRVRVGAPRLLGRSFRMDPFSPGSGSGAATKAAGPGKGRMLRKRHASHPLISGPSQWRLARRPRAREAKGRARRPLGRRRIASASRQSGVKIARNSRASYAPQTTCRPFSQT